MTQLFFFLVIIPSAILHEYMHGWAANQLGDSTARHAGRLTLNPMVHIDKWGTLIMPLLLYFGTGGTFLFAYAKPVPYNPYNLKNQKWGPSLVAAAGPLSNLLLAAILGQIAQYVPMADLARELLHVAVYANVLLGIFNLVPIPPLDGSKLLYALMPSSLDHVKAVLERQGFVLLIVFVLFFSHLISPIMQLFFGLFVGGGTLF